MRRILLASALLALSAAAVAVRVRGYPDFVPAPLAHALDRFIEPGATLWWLTMGATFQAFPSNWAGYVVVVIGNTLLWLIAITLTAIVVNGIRRAIERLRASAD